MAVPARIAIASSRLWLRNQARVVVQNSVSCVLRSRGVMFGRVAIGQSPSGRLASLVLCIGELIQERYQTAFVTVQIAHGPRQL
jgi:hypothetical protein